MNMGFNKYFSIAKSEVKQAIVDNKRLILLMASVYLISLFVSGFFSSYLLGAISSQTHAAGTHVSHHSTMNPALELFINNETAGILTYVMSIFFGINAFVSLIINGAILGVLSGSVIAESPIYGISSFLAYTVPHGIFEIPACILESVAGVLLFLFIFRFFKTIYGTKDASSFKLKAKKSWEVNKIYLKQSIVLMIFCCFLLIIAAFIEAYITDHVGNWVDSFFK